MMRLRQGFATRGVGAIMVEATAVVAEGRISPEDSVSIVICAWPRLAYLIL
jgi:hypothetical protein